MRFFLVSLWLVGCLPSKAQRAASSPSQALASTAHPATDDAEPEPEWHEHSEVSSDDLAAPSKDAPAPSGCTEQEPPPLAASHLQHVYSGPPITNRIPPELVMAPIRKRAACLRACYEAGLVKAPSLTGRISVRFVVDLDGWVRRARVQDSEIASGEVQSCIVRQFVGLHYPAPDSGAVTVVYPLRFEPGGS